MQWKSIWIWIGVCWLLLGCSREADRRAMYQIEKASLLMQSDAQGAYAMLTDSTVHPELLSSKVNAHWCRLLCELSDSIGTPLPYVPQMNDAYRYVERHGSVEEQLTMALYLGRCYMEDLEQEAALLIYSKALELSREEEKINQSGYICSYMGDVYQYQGMHPQAVDKYLSAADYFQQAGNFRSQGVAYVDASRNYTFMDSLDIALDYMLQADSILQKYGKLKDHASTLNGLGNIYRAKEDFHKAEWYFKRAIGLDSMSIANNRLALSDLYLELGDLQAARKNIDSIQNASVDKNVSVDKYYLLFLLEKEEGNLSSAIESLEHYVESVYAGLEAKNKANILEVEKKHDYTKLLIHLFQMKHRQSMLIGCAVALFLVLVVIVVLYRLQMKSRQLMLSKRENEIYLMKNQLLQREKELSRISDQLQRQTDLLNQKMEQLYLQKEQEVAFIRQQIQQKNQEMLEQAAITQIVRKQSAKVVPNATNSPLSSQEWTAVYELIEILYPSMKGFVDIYDLNEKEKRVYYLTMFQLSSNAEAVLMNQPVSSVNKYRQTLRKKLQINDRNVDLYEYLLTMM